MSKVFAFDLKNHFAIIVVLGCLIIIGGCTKVDVRVTGFCCSSSEDISLSPSCELSEKFLSITGYRQEASAWCWVANAQMVANYLNGISRPQCNIVNDLFNPSISSCCDDPHSSECNRGWYPEDALEKEGIASSTPVKNPAKEKLWGMITSQICEDNPLILAEYFLGGGGHSSVIYGFAGNGNAPWQRSVWALDPLDVPDPVVPGGPQGGMQWNFEEAIYFVSFVEDFYGREEIYITESFE